MNEAEILALAKPFLLQIVNAYVIPEITKLEGEIGNTAVQKVVTAVTASLEGVGVAALSAI